MRRPFPVSLASKDINEGEGVMPIMIRVLSILAAAALAVAAVPVASAGTSKKPPSQRGAGKVANLGAANDLSQLSLRNARTDRAVVVLIGANDYGLVAGRP
jgi:hypothetical protein